MAKHESVAAPQMHVKQIVALPGLGYMFAGTEKVWTFSSTNIWVQGSDLSGSVHEQFHQATQHFDGQKWTRYTIPFDSYGNIVSSSPTSAWATGFETIGGHGYTTDIVYLDHFDGTTWKNVVSGDARTYSFRTMVAVGNDFWYSSLVYNQVNQEDQTSIYHYNPSTGWNDVKTTGLPSTNSITRLVVLSSSNMWVVTDNNQVFHSSGQSWHEMPIQPLSRIVDISGSSSVNVWISGTGTNGKAIVEYWNGLQWQTIPLAPYPSGAIHDGVEDEAMQIFAFSLFDVWTRINVHPLVAGSPSSFFEHWNGWRWTLYTTPHYLSFYDIGSLGKEHALSAVTGDSTSMELVAFSA